MALIDFTLSNARRFYLSVGNPLGWKWLRLLLDVLIVLKDLHKFAERPTDMHFFGNHSKSTEKLSFVDKIIFFRLSKLFMKNSKQQD